MGTNLFALAIPCSELLCAVAGVGQYVSEKKALDFSGVRHANRKKERTPFIDRAATALDPSGSDWGYQPFRNAINQTSHFVNGKVSRLPFPPTAPIESADALNPPRADCAVSESRPASRPFYRAHRSTKAQQGIARFSQNGKGKGEIWN
jgi:hypothetical protein